MWRPMMSLNVRTLLPMTTMTVFVRCAPSAIPASKMTFGRGWNRARSSPVTPFEYGGTNVLYSSGVISKMIPPEVFIAVAMDSPT